MRTYFLPGRTALEFPDILQEKEKLIGTFSNEEKVSADKVSVIASPYRICPLGAHIDHQGGAVLGMAINAYTLMAYTASESGAVRLRSRNYPGEVSFDLTEVSESTGSFWGVYPRAAALALQEKYELRQGVTGILDGMLPGCGLSSSASVLLAYLHAFAGANSLEIEPWEYVHLTHRAEKKFIGLNNGILDQTSIVFGRRGYLLHIDTKEKEVRALPDQLGENHHRILVAFSGYSRELTTSGYNSRVDECRMAAEQISDMADKRTASLLSDISSDDYLRYKNRLDPHLEKRCNHFFNESQRVADGAAAWEKRAIEEFGRLMNESCISSMEKYACGMQAICDLQQIVSSTEGVFGSRFMGGGFGGCVVGFVKPSHASEAVENIKAAYQGLHPEVARQVTVNLAHSDDGVRLI